MPASSRPMHLFGFAMHVSSRSMNLFGFVMPVSSRSMPLSQAGPGPGPGPSQTKPGPGPSQAKPNQDKPSQAKPNQAKPNQAKPSQTKPSQAKFDCAELRSFRRGCRALWLLEHNVLKEISTTERFFLALGKALAHFFLCGTVPPIYTPQMPEKQDGMLTVFCLYCASVCYTKHV